MKPYSFEGWQYIAPTETFENDADGGEFVCGERFYPEAGPVADPAPRELAGRPP